MDVFTFWNCTNGTKLRNAPRIIEFQRPYNMKRGRKTLQNMMMHQRTFLFNNAFSESREQLIHFQPMFDLCRNQVVGFYYQNVWKHLWKRDILSKDAGVFQTFC